MAPYAVAPLVESGLHCGPASPTRVLIPLAASPRSSRAGSIAAGQPPRLPRRGWRVAPLVESGLHCGDAVLAVGLVVGAGRPARRERAPLRRLAERPTADAVTVAPLVESGLHCGIFVRTGPVQSRSCRPARRERAPLRRDEVGRDRLVPLRRAAVFDGLRADVRRPARRERAPLRRRGRLVVLGLLVASPRSSRAGSIAAASFAAWSRSISSSPRSSRAGSIAAEQPPRPPRRG